MNRLDLVPIYATFRHGQLDNLAAGLEAAFGVEVRRRVPWFDPETAYDGARGQYDSTRLLHEMADGASPDGEVLLGVIGVDLFVPVLTYVFGEAQLGGRSAVVSTHRLDPRVYGLPDDQARLDERLLKESVHELGHVLGLLHCGNPRCVMHASTWVEDIDQKPATFCDACWDRTFPLSRSSPACVRSSR